MILEPKPLDMTAPDLYQTYGFNQLIDIPTRLTEQTTSLIDLIFTDNEENIVEHGTVPKIVDHEGVMVCLDVKKRKIKTGKENKYAIHAYTHGPVTGSGPSVVNCSVWLPIG